ncbi:hypothetical protein DL96DRAFT_1604878 [Flagelloscypha sp. PMI_526]|nr:hypothetical protein DL96DRAFT_1604878 [Flagelloscypha sp. PMI_526]
MFRVQLHLIPLLRTLVLYVALLVIVWFHLPLPNDSDLDTLLRQRGGLTRFYPEYLPSSWSHLERTRATRGYFWDNDYFALTFRLLPKSKPNDSDETTLAIAEQVNITLYAQSVDILDPLLPDIIISEPFTVRCLTGHLLEYPPHQTGIPHIPRLPKGDSIALSQRWRLRENREVTLRTVTSLGRKSLWGGREERTVEIVSDAEFVDTNQSRSPQPAVFLKATTHNGADWTFRYSCLNALVIPNFYTLVPIIFILACFGFGLPYFLSRHFSHQEAATTRKQLSVDQGKEVC